MTEGSAFEELVEGLIGSQIIASSHAADMREFAFGHRGGRGDSGPGEVFLHVQCPWRLEFGAEIVTGNFDWFEPADPFRDMGGDWDPATGGSLQELKLRRVFKDEEPDSRVLRNQSDGLRVTSVRITPLGDLEIDLTGHFRLRLFPSGSRGEHWRVFVKGDLRSHFVCEGSRD